jgi:hypothetical protein
MFSQTKRGNYLVVVLARAAASLFFGVDDFWMLVGVSWPLMKWGLDEPCSVVIHMLTGAAGDTVVFQLSGTLTADVLGQFDKIVDLVPVEILEDIVEVVGLLELKSPIHNCLPGDQVFGDFGPKFSRETT